MQWKITRYEKVLFSEFSMVIFDISNDIKSLQRSFFKLIIDSREQQEILLHCSTIIKTTECQLKQFVASQLVHQLPTNSLNILSPFHLRQKNYFHFFYVEVCIYSSRYYHIVFVTVSSSPLSNKTKSKSLKWMKEEESNSHASLKVSF